MEIDLLNSTTLIRYNQNEYEKKLIEDVQNLIPIQKNDFIQWFNTYGSVNTESIKEIIIKNNLDDFLFRLLSDEHTNKVIELDNFLFVSIDVFRLEDSYMTEKMVFVLNSQFIWSIQEKKR